MLFKINTLWLIKYAETLIDEARLDIVQKSIDFDHRWVVPREGRERFGSFLENNYQFED